MIEGVVARIITVAVALAIAATNVLPRADGYRCVTMGRQMAAEGDCCPRCDTATAAIAPPCCESTSGLVVEARASAPSEAVRIASAPQMTLLSDLALASNLVDLAARRLAARPRGRPPGEQLELFSTILRI